jgi:cellulose synthase/poly-beta-1,6-N-acetylglucosamine synthase-like glycosyltransferase
VEIVINLIYMVDIILLLYLGFSAIYFFVFSVLSLFYREKNAAQNHSKHKVIVLIPAYKEDNVIVQTALTVSRHISEKADISVMVIADSLQQTTIYKLKDTGARVVPVHLETSTKSAAIREALLNSADINADNVVVLDADNIIHQNFMDEIITRMEQGYQIVQGHRTAKNINTSLAILDGLSEEINNAIFRKGHRVVNLSASLIGSGFICDFSLFKDLITQSQSVGGFDKELELMLIEQKITIGFAQKAIVFDEKVQQPDAFVNQRRRWLSVQFKYFRENILKGFVQLFKKGNMDYFDKLMQFLVLPRILILGITGIITFLHLLIHMIYIDKPVAELGISWGVAFIATGMALLIALPGHMYNANTLKALWSLPKGFILTLRALIKIKGANKSFIHTEHGIKQ